MLVLSVTDSVTLWDLLVCCMFSCLRKHVLNWSQGCWNNLILQIAWIQVQIYLTLVKNSVPWFLQLNVSLWAACLLSGRLGEAQDCWWTWRPMKRLFIQTSSTVKMSLGFIPLHLAQSLSQQTTTWCAHKILRKPWLWSFKDFEDTVYIHLLYLYPLTCMYTQTHKSMPDEINKTYCRCLQQLPENHLSLKRC